MIRALTWSSFASFLFAQSPAPKAPEFHLPAGDYSLTELLQRAEQAVRSPIRAPDGAVRDVPLRLQSDLALPEQLWQDVLGGLLSTRDLLLVRDAAGTGYEALPKPAEMVGWIGERAQPLSVEQLFARRALTGPVRVVAITEADARKLTMSMRMVSAAYDLVLSHESVDGGLQLVGLAESVRFALTQLAQQVPDLAGSLPAAAARPWPRTASGSVHRFAAGTFRVAQLVDLFAASLGRNIVLAPELVRDAATIAVADAIVGDDLHCEEQLTALLWQARVVVLEVSAPHGLFEAVRLAPRTWPKAARCQELRPEELLARPALVAWVSTSPVLGPLTAAQLAAEFRAAAAIVPGATSLTIAVLPGGSRLSGLSSDVLPLLQRLEQLKAAKK